jgi:hypothetical protein
MIAEVRNEQTAVAADNNASREIQRRVRGEPAVTERRRAAGANDRCNGARGRIHATNPIVARVWHEDISTAIDADIASWTVEAGVRRHTVVAAEGGSTIARNGLYGPLTGASGAGMDQQAGCSAVAALVSELAECPIERSTIAQRT